MSQNFEQTQQTQEQQAEELVLGGARATLVWDEDTGEATGEDDAPGSQEQTETDDSGSTDTPDIDLSMLDLPEDKQTEEKAEEEITKAPGYQEFSEDFKKFTGLELNKAVELINELQSYKQQQLIDNQRNQLQTAWGIAGKDFDTRLQQVQERFAKYPPELQVRLDNPEGAQLIWAKIQQEQTSKQKQIPQLQKGSKSTAAKSNHLFTRQQISKMSDSEYSANAAKIAYAYANGLVK